MLFVQTIALAIHGLLCFHVAFLLFFPSSVKKNIGILMGFFNESVYYLWKYSDFYNIISANRETWKVLLSFVISFFKVLKFAL